MTFKFSEKVQIVKIYNYRADTREFIGSGDGYIPPYTGLPANCTDIQPPALDVGFAAVYNPASASWSVVEDYRRLTVYRIDTGEPLYISKLGALPDDTTTVAPTGEYQKWNGSEWVVDEVAQHAAAVAEAEQHKETLLITAQQSIAVLQTKLMMGRKLTDDETDKVNKTLDFIDEVTAIDTDSAPGIQWPEL